jgi:hypothetical protein
MINPEKYRIDLIHFNWAPGSKQDVFLPIPDNAVPLYIEYCHEDDWSLAYLYKQAFLLIPKTRTIKLIATGEEFFPKDFHYFQSVNTQFGKMHVFVSTEFMLGDYNDDGE